MLLTLLDAATKASSMVDIPKIIDKLVEWGINVGKDLIGAILIYIIGRFIIRQISRLVAKILEKRKLQTFLKSLLSILLNLILAFAIVSRLGVETTSFAAILASAGVAIGMALSGNLSNFAGGLIILVFKPFKVGDYIDGQGASGTVKEIQIFHTILSTVDNRIIYVPNGSLSSNAITNPTCRMGIRCGIRRRLRTRQSRTGTHHCSRRTYPADSGPVHRSRISVCQQR